jgi:hypothetical protein
MTDASLINLGPFFERYDRRNQRLMVGALCASLMLASAIATHLLATGGPGLKGVRVIWGTGVVFTPLFIAGWWAFGGIMALRRRRAAPLDGSHPAGPVDAGNGMRIANAGFAFNLALMAAMLAGQAVIALVVFGFGHQIRGDLIARAIMLTIGLATIYLGNLWPRMPVSRVPERKAAATMKANRYAGWFMVAVGLIVFLWGVFVPFSPAAQPPFEPSKHSEISLPQTELDRFVGRYDFGNGFVVSVTHPGATLWVRREGINGEPGAPVYPEGPSAFFWKMVEAQISFTLDANGAVTAAAFREGDMHVQGKRLTQ